MLFYEPQFLVFSATLFSILTFIHSNEKKKVVLLFASYVFYMCWNPAFILLIVFSTGVDFFVGQRMAAEESRPKRRVLLILSLCANLGLLAYFKYVGLFSEGALWLLRESGFEPSWTSIHVILPVGSLFIRSSP